MFICKGMVGTPSLKNRRFGEDLEKMKGECELCSLRKGFAGRGDSERAKALGENIHECLRTGWKPLC